MLRMGILLAMCVWPAAASAAGQARPVRQADRTANEVTKATEASNVLTRFLDWADIHPAQRLGRLSVFPITLSRPGDRLGGFLTMRQALEDGLLVVEELPDARVSQDDLPDGG